MAIRGKRNIKTNSLNYFDSLLDEVKKEDVEKIEAELVNVESKETQEKYEVVVSEEILLDKSGFSYINNLDIDNETKEFLTEEYKKYFNFSANSSIWLGAYYQNLFDGLGQRDKGGANQYTSTYADYIENVLKVSVRTAKRYRDKYELFSFAKDIKVKTMIAFLSHADVKLLYDNKEKIIPYLEKTLSPEELENLIKNSAIESAKQEQLELKEKTFNIDINSFQDKILTIGERAANLFNKETLTKEEREKAIKISKHIKEIEKLLF